MPDDFLTIHVGQTAIEKDQIRPGQLNSPQSLVTVADWENGTACGKQLKRGGKSGDPFSAKNARSDERSPLYPVSYIIPRLARAIGRLPKSKGFGRRDSRAPDNNADVTLAQGFVNAGRGEIGVR